MRVTLQGSDLHRQTPPLQPTNQKMPLYHNSNNVPNAQKLRKNMTPEEKMLWYQFLKRLPLTVNRQKSIGNYIADFYIHSHSLVIEIDGRQHKLPENRIADDERDQFFWAMGITVLRYSNQDINRNFSVVCEDILKYLDLNATDLRQPHTR